MGAKTFAEHLKDIEIPDIEITDGWSCSDVKTLEDCEDAAAYLTGALAGMEYQIDAEAFKPLAEQRGEWVARVKAAVRFKKAAMTIVGQKRAAINRQREAERQEQECFALLAFVQAAIPPAEWVRITSAFYAGRPKVQAA